MRRWHHWLLLLSWASGVAFALRVYSVSPPSVAVHFGPKGLPDRWGPPSELLLLNLCLLSVGTALFLALPQLVRRLPSAVVNLPNKGYWLGPERREQATVKLAGWCNVFGAALNAFVIGLQALLAPRAGAPVGGSQLPLLLTIAFVAFTLGSCVWLARSFRLPTGPG